MATHLASSPGDAPRRACIWTSGGHDGRGGHSAVDGSDGQPVGAGEGMRAARSSQPVLDPWALDLRPSCSARLHGREQAQAEAREGLGKKKNGRSRKDGAGHRDGLGRGAGRMARRTHGIDDDETFSHNAGFGFQGDGNGARSFSWGRNVSPLSPVKTCKISFLLMYHPI